MNRPQLLAHLEHEHRYRPARDGWYRQKPSHAELKNLHTRLHLQDGDVHPDPATSTKGETMSTDLQPLTDNLPELMRREDLTPAERAERGRHAMEYVPVDGFDRPIPRFATFLPDMSSNQQVRDAIAAQMFAAEDPDALPDAESTPSMQSLKGQDLTVHALGVRPGTLEDGWAFYLLLDVTAGDDPEHFVANTGAQDIVTRLAVAWMRNELPLRGRVVEKQTAGGAKNRPLRFVAEKDFVAANGEQQVGA